MNEDLETQARHFERIAAELERAREHARTAAAHFRRGEVPPGCAHALAMEGHLLQVRDDYAAAARLHATKAEPLPEDQLA